MKTITPVVGSFDPRLCSRCQHNRVMCRCKYPFPTKPERGLYSRAMYESDLEGIERIEQGISRVVAAYSADPGVLTVQVDTRFQSKTNLGGFAKRQQAECDWMRRLCKAALFETRMILAAKQSEDPKLEKAVALTDRHGVRLSTAQQEHIRRFAIDPVYRAKAMAKILEARSGNQSRKARTDQSGG